MKPEKQRIAIAEVCGWSQSDNGWWSHPALPDNGGAEPEPPDYLNDLNAIRTAITSVITTKERRQLFEWNLSNLLKDVSWDIINATASQLSETFLNTLGKWENE